MDNSNAALRIYLNDHLGGATMAWSCSAGPAARRTGSVQTQLQELTTDVERDRNPCAP